MTTMLNDTAPWATELLNARRRGLSPAQKLALVDDMNRGVFQLVLLGLLQRHPASVAHRMLIERRLGPATRLIDSYANEEIMEPNITETMLDFTRICERLAVPYVVGGSVASALYGEERNTRDVDILIQLKSAQAEDVILAKLEWFKLSNRQLDHQWRDIRAVLDVQSDVLDLQYLREWATILGMSALLEKAIANQNPHDEPDANQLRLF